jgi:Polyketide cyclase / dehydrase and lipid transport
MEKVIIIERPINEVFNYVADCDNSREYLGSSFHFKSLTPRPHGVGTKAVALCNYMGANIRIDYNMVEYVPNQRMKLVAKDQNMNGIKADSVALWQFQEAGPGRTKVSFMLDIQPRGLEKFGPMAKILAAPIMSAAQTCVSMVLDKALVKLKARMESNVERAAVA